MKCTQCHYKKEFYTSRSIAHEGMQGSKSVDVNSRMIYTMRACSQGYAGIEKFTTLMDMPKPMTKNDYNKTIKKLTETVAKEIMSDAIEELRTASSVPTHSIMDSSFTGWFLVVSWLFFP